ncbi:MAG: signal peptidase I [Candidatus Aminicenantes bacterium RBG_13_62_12]|nr:MAG: signal peptidase I [Candidatus Aminicenantes bacterium RBG_13_62_12]
MSRKKEKKPRTKGVLREWFELLAETAVFVFFILTFVVQSFGIPTPSMEPTLLVGDFMLVNRMVNASTVFGFEKAILPRREFRRGDIVAFKAPPENLIKDYVKRVIALEGERVEILGKRVLIDGQPLSEPYKVHLFGSLPLDGDDFGPLIVPRGHVLVLGDNRDNSADGRVWGFLPAEYVKGIPWLIYFSYRAEPNAHLKTALGDRIKRLVSFLPKARWNRVLKLVR